MRVRRLLATVAAVALAASAWVGAQLPAAAEDTETPTTIYLAGDSTVASYSASAYPLMGWGQKLGDYLADDVVIDNRAIGGRSAKSYVLEGHLDRLLADIDPGDYLFVQFGHNDRQNTDSLCPSNPTYCNRHTEPYTSFKEYLRKYIDGARQHGATPVLVTPMGRRSYDGEGKFGNDFYDYAQAMKQLSAEHDVPLIDLNSTSIAFYTRIGPPATEEIFFYTEPGEYEAYPTGKEDNVHFQEYGAGWLARFVAEGMVATGLPIAPQVRFADADPWNLATHATVTASSSLEADDWYLWNVADGVTSSVPHGLGWSSSQTLDLVDHTEWVQFDLGEVMPLTRTVLVPRNDPGNEGVHFPVDYTVQVSDDATTWTTVAEVTDSPAVAAQQEITFPVTAARYVKVEGTRLRQHPGDLAYRLQLAEVKLYSDVVSVRLTGPAELLDRATGTYAATLRVPSTVAAVSNARFDLVVPDGWSSKTIPTGTPYLSTWEVTAPKSGRADGSPPVELRTAVTFKQSGEWRTVSDELLVGRPVPEPPPVLGDHWVSDLPLADEVNGWGPIERDMSNGDDGAGDGRPLSLGGIGHAKGLGVHADSSVTIALDQCRQFTAVIGVDDEVGDGGSVSFTVEGDGEPLLVHPVATGRDPGQPVTVDVTGVSRLRLLVDDLANKGNDHADWASAKLSGCAS